MQSTQNHDLLNLKNQTQKFYKSNSCVDSRVRFRRLKTSAVKVTPSSQFTFLNISFDKGRLKNFVWWFFQNYGQKKTIQLLEEFKTLGFAYATQGGISLGIDDLKIPPRKKSCLLEADRQIEDSLFQYERGQITGIERFQNLIETWHQTSESLKQEVIHYFEMTDIFNPVYMMAFSGARGNISQVRQLVGMRGLMADPQGQIIDFPIRSNFREGLTLTEYIISTYGARKGIVDTALRTATAGYLTRRLVDVAQHVVVSQFDCGTTRGIFLFDMKEGPKTLYSFKDRLIGRVLAQNVLTSEQGEDSQMPSQILAYRNQEISSELAHSISQLTNKALVRSTLTCETRKLVCQLCYGWSLAKGKLVSLGEAVGIIAAQSIGEPGTQLTMRTFHTGGVFSGGISDQIVAPSDGILSYLQPIPGTCIRTPQGKIAFLTKAPGSFVFHFSMESETDMKPMPNSEVETQKQEIYQIPAYTILFAKNKQKVFKKQTLAQLSAISKQQAIQADAEQMIYAGLEGQVYFSHLNLIEQSNEKHGDMTWKTEDWSKIWILSGKIYESPMISSFFPVGGDLVNQNSIVNDINWWTAEKCSIDLESFIWNPQHHKKPTFVHPQSLKLSTRVESPKNSFTKKDISTDFLGNAVHSFVNKQYSLKSSQKFQLKTQITSSRLSDLKFNSQSITRNHPCEFKNSLMSDLKGAPNFTIQDQKCIKLSFPFYYPFQQISKKRLFQFLYSTSSHQSSKQPTFWISKKSQYWTHRVFKKVLKFRKVEILQLQNRWKPWHIRFKIQPFAKISLENQLKPGIVHKTIHSKQKQKLPFFKELQKVRLAKRDLSKYKPFSKKPRFHNNLSTFSSLKSMLPSKGTFRFVLKSSDCQIRKWNFQKKSSSFGPLNDPLAENYFQNASFLLKHSIFHLNIQQIVYKKLAYKFILENSFPKSLPIEIVPYFGLNPNFFLELNLKKSQYTNENAFSPASSIQTRVIKNRYLESYNSFSWTTFAHDFFSYFPKMAQSSNNGIFFQNHEFHDALRKPNFKHQYKDLLNPNVDSVKAWKKVLLPVLRVIKVNNENLVSIPLPSPYDPSKIQPKIQELQNIRAFQQTTKYIGFRNLQYQMNQKLKRLTPLKAKKLSAMSEWNSAVLIKSSFYKMPVEENPLRWSFLMPSGMQHKGSKVNPLKTPLQKYDVSFNEVFWLPQENYQFSTLNSALPNSEIHCKNYFISAQEPMIQLLNHQGLKKDVNSNLEGILHYSKRLTQKPWTVSEGTRQSFDPTSLQKETLTLKKFQKMGNQALHTIDSLLQSRVLFAIFKKKTNHSNFFFDIFQQRTKNLSGRKITPSFFANRYHRASNNIGVQCFPILKQTMYANAIRKDPTSTTAWFFMNQNLESLQLENTHITVKQGWIYHLDDVSKFNIGHQSFINPGVSFLDHICLNHQAVFIEVLQPFNSVKSDVFHSKKTIRNKNSRFGNPKRSKGSSIQLLLRPISFHLFENTEKTKFKFNQMSTKRGDFSFSFLTFKKFYSNVWNQQKATGKLFASFPLPDIQVKSMLKKRKTRSVLSLTKTHGFHQESQKLERTLIAQKNILQCSLLFQKIDKKQFNRNHGFQIKQGLRPDGIPNRLNPNLISIYTKSYQRTYSSFISMYSLNLCPLSIKGVITSDSKAPFQIPLVQLLDVQSKWMHLSMNSNSFHEIQKRLLEFLIWKKAQTTTSNLVSPFPTLQPMFNSQNSKQMIQKNKEQEFCVDPISTIPIEMFQAIGSALPIPTFIGSYSQKVNSFYNQRFLNDSALSHILNKQKNEYETPISTLNRQFLHSFPIIKNQLFVYSNGQVFPSDLIGKTSALSPFEGEVLNSNCWSDGSSTSFLLNENLNSAPDQVGETSTFLFLTKSDLTTLSFPEFFSSEISPLSSKFDSYLSQSKQKNLQFLYQKRKSQHASFQQLEDLQNQKEHDSNWEIGHFELKYQNKIYTIQGFQLGLPSSKQKFRLGRFLVPGEVLFKNAGIPDSGQIIHLNAKELTLRYAQCISASPNGILHTYNGHFIQKNHPIMTLPFQTLKTGDIVQGIPKVEQYLEARTTQQGRLFVRSLPVLIQAIFERYCLILPRETAARQSFLKIQQILVDGVQRVYRSQGISIADKHLEVIVKQMASKVQIVFGGQTGFFPGELVDLDFVERINKKVLVKVHYEPVILGITRASLEVDSFLSAASFQQTTKILARAAIYKQKDYLKGLKENLLIGNLLPAGTGFFSKMTE